MTFYFRHIPIKTEKNTFISPFQSQKSENTLHASSDPIWVILIHRNMNSKREETSQSMKRLQLEPEQLAPSDPRPSHKAISPIGVTILYLQKVSSCTRGVLFTLRKDHHSAPPPLFSLCSPIIVINGSSQRDQSGWPIISGPKDWMCRLRRKSRRTDAVEPKWRAAEIGVAALWEESEMERVELSRERAKERKDWGRKRRGNASRRCEGWNEWATGGVTFEKEPRLTDVMDAVLQRLRQRGGKSMSRTFIYGGRIAFRCPTSVPAHKAIADGHYFSFHDRTLSGHRNTVI